MKRDVVSSLHRKELGLSLEPEKAVAVECP
jgi:hypothetical protein